ncbi:MAG: hypothetical protein HHAS10_05330 [Candidatus Altimarinota bacterium]
MNSRNSHFIRAVITGTIISLSGSNALATGTVESVEKLLTEPSSKLRYSGWSATEEELIFLRSYAKRLSESTDNKIVSMQSMGVYNGGKFLVIRGEVYYFKRDTSTGFSLTHLKGLKEKTVIGARAYMEGRIIEPRRPGKVTLPDRVL